jgi:hypothetical protein
VKPKQKRCELTISRPHSKKMARPEVQPWPIGMHLLMTPHCIPNYCLFVSLWGCGLFEGKGHIYFRVGLLQSGCWRDLVVGVWLPMSEHCGLLNKGVGESSLQCGLRETSTSVPHFPRLASPTYNYCGLSAVGAQRIFHIGWVCFPKQVCIVLKPWCKAPREQIEVDTHTRQ